jgi:RNA polymerase sigma-70 factor (ECF subfamily)
LKVSKEHLKPYGRDASNEDLLLDYAQNGTHASFARLVERHRDHVYRLALFYCGEKNFAEDITQEVFVRLLINYKKFKPQGPGSFSRWFYSFIPKQTKCALRDRRRQRRRDQVKAHIGLSSTFAVASSLDENGISLDETQKMLSDAVSKLEEKLRLPVVLHYFNGLSQSDIAEVVGVTPQMVGRRLEKALSLLRTRLADRGFSAAIMAENLTQLGQSLVVDKTLRETIGRLTDHSALPHQLRISSKPTAKSKAGAIMKTALPVGGAVVAVAVVATFFWLYEAGTELVIEQAAPPVVLSPDGPPWHWDFNAGFPGNLEPLFGKWDWTASGGADDSGALKIANVGLLAFPKNCPDEFVLAADFSLPPSADLADIKILWGADGTDPGEFLVPMGVNHYFINSSDKHRTVDGFRRLEVYANREKRLMITELNGVPIEWWEASQSTDLSRLRVCLQMRGGKLDNMVLRAAGSADRDKAEKVLKQESFSKYDLFDAPISSAGFRVKGMRWIPQGGVGGSGAIECRPDADEKGVFILLTCADSLVNASQWVRFDYCPLTPQTITEDALNAYILDAQEAAMSDTELDKTRSNAIIPNRRLEPATYDANRSEPFVVNQWHDVLFVLNPRGTVCFVDGKLHAAWADPRPEISRTLPKKMFLVFRGEFKLDNLRRRVTDDRFDSEIISKIRTVDFNR